MQRKSPAFQWYPKDCDSDEKVRAMDDREFGFYVRCLNHSWLNDGLPADLDRLSVVMHRTRSYVGRVWPALIGCFEEQNGRLVNPRQERERKSQSEFNQAMVEAGRRSGEVRRAKYTNLTRTKVEPTFTPDDEILKKRFNTFLSDEQGTFLPTFAPNDQPVDSNTKPLNLRSNQVRTKHEPSTNSASASASASVVQRQSQSQLQSQPHSSSAPEPLILKLEDSSLPPIMAISGSEMAVCMGKSKKKPKTKLNTPTLEQRAWFSEWWEIYWRRVARKSAEESFGRKVQDQNRFDAVMQATKAQTPAMMARTIDHRPHGATWLNQERWNDEPERGRIALVGAGRPPTFGEIKQQRQQEIFRNLVAYDLENRR